MYCSEQNQKFLTVKEVSQLLRKKERTINEMCYNRQIPHYKVGRTTLFKLDEIIEWMHNYCKVDPITNPTLRESRLNKPNDRPPILTVSDKTVTTHRH